jgi:hypothetical protein
MDIDKKDQPESEVDVVLDEHALVTAVCMLMKKLNPATIVAMIIFLGWVEGFLDKQEMPDGFDVMPDHMLVDAAIYEAEVRGIVELGGPYKWNIPEKDRKVLEEAFFLWPDVSHETELFQALGYEQNPWKTLRKLSTQDRKTLIMERARKARAAKATEPKPEDGNEEAEEAT